jgi:hypothetical protein
MSAVGSGRILEVCGKSIVVPPTKQEFRMDQFSVSRGQDILVTDFGSLFITQAFFHFFIAGEGVVERPVEYATAYMWREIGAPMACGDVLKKLVGDESQLERLQTPLQHVFAILREHRRNDHINVLLTNGYSNYFCVQNQYNEFTLLDVWRDGDRFGIDALLAGFASLADLEAADRFYHPDTLVLPQTEVGSAAA